MKTLVGAFTNQRCNIYRLYFFLSIFHNTNSTIHIHVSCVPYIYISTIIFKDLYAEIILHCAMPMSSHSMSLALLTRRKCPEMDGWAGTDQAKDTAKGQHSPVSTQATTKHPASRREGKWTGLFLTWCGMFAKTRRSILVSDGIRHSLIALLVLCDYSITPLNVFRLGYSELPK